MCEEKNLYEKLLEKKRELFDEYDATRRAGERNVQSARRYGKFKLALGSLEDQMIRLLEEYGNGDDSTNDL